MSHPSHNVDTDISDVDSTSPKLLQRSGTFTKLDKVFTKPSTNTSNFVETGDKPNEEIGNEVYDIESGNNKENRINVEHGIEREGHNKDDTKSNTSRRCIVIGEAVRIDYQQLNDSLHRENTIDDDQVNEIVEELLNKVEAVHELVFKEGNEHVNRKNESDSETPANADHNREVEIAEPSNIQDKEEGRDDADPSSKMNNRDEAGRGAESSSKISNMFMAGSNVAPPQTLAPPADSTDFSEDLRSLSAQRKKKKKKLTKKSKHHSEDTELQQINPDQTTKQYDGKY
uniref:Uncharacterized protein n=1 Tax=Cacopsylla melanoneura TaxID=428564 RepID=A0A8D8W3A3_9HEMI